MLAGPLAGMYSTWLLSQADAVRARDAARRCGFAVNLLSDDTRSCQVNGPVAGFGGVCDADLDRALAALAAGLGGSRR